MSTIFFYGLFMDEAVLIQKGLKPEFLGLAQLPDFRIHIGNRATLLPSPHANAYGAVMKITDEEAAILYAEPSVRDYQPESVQVKLMASAEIIAVLCYNLPPNSGKVGSNQAYAERLIRVAQKLGLPSPYVDEIAAFA